MRGSGVPEGCYLIIELGWIVVIAVEEVGTADGDVVGRGGKAIDPKSVDRKLLRIVVVASSRAVVSRGDRGGDALRGSLSPERIEEAVCEAAQAGFAEAKTQAYDGGDVAVDGVLHGEEEAGFQSGVGSDYEIDGGRRSDGSGPLYVEIGFDGVKIRAVGIVDAIDAGIISVDDDLGRIGAEAEQAAELVDQLDVNVGVVDNCNRLVGAVGARGIERTEMVLDGVV